MTIHFICRGNVFRSLIAETYLRSLNIAGVRALSSGTVADKTRSSNVQYLANTQNLLARHGIARYAKKESDQLTPERINDKQVIICMNQRVVDEASDILTLPKGITIWDISDIGEPGRALRADGDRRKYEEEVFAEVVQKINRFMHEHRTVNSEVGDVAARE